VPKLLDLIDSTLPWITARPGNVLLVTPLLSGYIAGNSLDNVIAVGNKYIKSYSGCNLIDGALSWITRECRQRNCVWNCYNWFWLSPLHSADRTEERTKHFHEDTGARVNVSWKSRSSTHGR